MFKMRSDNFSINENDDGLMSAATCRRGGGMHFLKFKLKVSFQQCNKRIVKIG